MTTFVASLHLPYMVRFNEDGTETPSRPTSSSNNIGAPKINTNSTSPAINRKSRHTIELPPPGVNFSQPTPYNEVATPMPNLLQTLGHPSPPVQTPGIPATPGGEELFFQLHDGQHHVALGSPSEPSIHPLRTPGPGGSRLSRSVRATPAIVPTDSGAREDYFAIPTTAMIQNRKKRRSSATSKSSFDELWTIERNDYGNGGLRNAVAAAEEAGHPTETICVGTLGFGTSALDESTKVAIEGRLREDHGCLVAFVSDADFDGHYNHYSKEVLWPVFHYQIPDHPKSKAFLDHSWKYFEALNRAVADVIVKDYKRGDTIWVNDYHLLLVPRMLREALGADAKIGFFLHVGFPSSEIFRCLAHREKLLEGMLGATLIGFQAEEYARHFLTTCSRLLNVEARNDSVVLDHSIVKVISLPIGIDPANLDRKRQEDEVTEWAEALRKRYEGKKLLVARDKLDGVRGVRQKLLAYELFLKKHPEWVGKVVLIQVALTTTSIVELQSTVVDIVTRINCTYSTLEYQPVVYLHQDITYQQYIALLENADALVVTSLRDGMNLTSHEFVYLQNKKHAPLVLSEFTGSSYLFNGAEISVNPWDHSMCAEAFLQALTMSDEEKKQRWDKLYKAVTNKTASHWFTEFLRILDISSEENKKRGTSSIPRLSGKGLLSKYKSTKKHLFFLDYEGTLVSWGAPNSDIITSPQRVLDIVNDLLLDPSNIVYIMSGHRPQDLEQVFLRVPGVGLIAEGGCYLRPFQSDTWLRLADDHLPWKKPVRDILEYYKERTPGTMIRERNCSFIWHHEKAEDPVAAGRQSGDCCNHINDSCESFRVHAVPIANGVLVEPLDWTKVTACEKVVDMNNERGWKVDFLMVAGDNRDDEPVFEWADKLAKEEGITACTTVRVGTGHTQANSTTNGVAGVVTALQKLAEVGY